MLKFIDSHLNEEYLTKYGKYSNVFIETGTYRGDSIWLALEHKQFEAIYSCEIFAPLYYEATQLFKDQPKVHLSSLDSPDFIVELFKDGHLDPTDRATIWLDAHASGPLGGGKSGGSPVVDELKAILEYSKRKDHTILIDDRRLFGSEEWSFVKEEDAIALLKEINPDYVIEYLDGVIEKDIICAYII